MLNLQKNWSHCIYSSLASICQPCRDYNVFLLHYLPEGLFLCMVPLTQWLSFTLFSSTWRLVWIVLTFSLRKSPVLGSSAHTCICLPRSVSSPELCMCVCLTRWDHIGNCLLALILFSSISKAFVQSFSHSLVQLRTNQVFSEEYYVSLYLGVHCWHFAPGECRHQHPVLPSLLRESSSTGGLRELEYLLVRLWFAAVARSIESFGFLHHTVTGSSL